MNPYIEIGENINNEIELDKTGSEIYPVYVHDRNLRLFFFIVKDNDSVYINKVVNLTINGLDPESDYPSDDKDGDICKLDPYLKQEHFGSVLDDYEIELKDVSKLTNDIYVSNSFTISKEIEKKISEMIIDQLLNK